MSNINSHQSNIEFIPAICPSCGGELRVPENRETIKCMYCGVEVVLHAKNTLGDKPSLDTIAHLAKIAIQGENYSEAYHYFSMALEIDHTSKYGWASKGLCAAWLSNPNVSRFDEAIHCIQEALRLGLREDCDNFEITFLSLADSIVAYTKSVTAHLTKEYEERLIALGSGTSHVDIEGIFQLRIRLTEEFFTEYAEAIEKSLYFIWQNLPSPKIARKIQFLQWDFNYIACPWLYTLDYRLTQGIACPQFISDLLSIISNSGDDPFGDRAEQRAKETEQIAKIKELREKGPQWNRYVDDWDWRTFIERVYNKIKPRYYMDYELWNQFYKEEYDPSKGYRVWCLVENEASPTSFVYKNQNDYLLGIWLRYGEADRVIGFEFNRRGYGTHQCGISEKELLSSLVALEEAEIQKQDAEKARIEVAKLNQEALEKEESQKKRKLQQCEQLPWWKKMLP